MHTLCLLVDSLLPVDKPFAIASKFMSSSVNVFSFVRIVTLGTLRSKFISIFFT